MGKFHAISADAFDYQQAVKGTGRYGNMTMCVLLCEWRPDFVEGLLRMPGFFSCGLFDSRDAAIEELERRYAEHEHDLHNYAEKSAGVCNE